MTDVYVLLIGGNQWYAPMWAKFAARQHLTDVAGCPAFVREADSGEMLIAFGDENGQQPAFDALLMYLQQRKPGTALTISAHRQHEVPTEYGAIRCIQQQLLNVGGETLRLAAVVRGLSSGEVEWSAVVSSLPQLREASPMAVWRTIACER